MSKVTKSDQNGTPSRNFRLAQSNSKLMGVCGGIGNYLGVDPMLVRVGFVIGGLVSVGTAGLIYVAIGLIAD
ncbi:MAG: PspC domain-containing protein [Erythrobacter sp.]